MGNERHSNYYVKSKTRQAYSKGAEKMKGIIALAILILFTLICDYAAVRVSDRKYKEYDFEDIKEEEE